MTTRSSQWTPDGSNFTTEASSLGLQPGEWPPFVDIDGTHFGFASEDVRGGELLGVRYRSQDGKVALIIND